ncbi:MAG TPA: tetratricopeptide repeat protein [Kofleriaceae bacterium]|nr:tetratricopeptide repeat protein [Kofleriaceae bacterium]
MKQLVVAFALLAACRGDNKDAGPSHGSALSVSGSGSTAGSLPKLPLTEDGKAMLRALDAGIEGTRERPAEHIGLLLQRAGIRGRVEDYTRALAAAGAFAKASPTDEAALRARVQALVAVHRFGDARAAIAELAKVIHPSFLPELEVGIDQATGNLDRALATREQIMKDAPSPQTITLYAMTLAEAGRFDEALALLPKGTAAIRLNTPDFVSWLLFQWGRIYEQKGDTALARDFYEEAYRRLPGSLEAAEHLVGVLVATGDTERAKRIVATAVAENYHPTLRALAVKLGVSKESAADVAAEWERYVAALPEAFADHAARFYLDAGANPKRALELARLNFANRPTFAARALVVEAALAAGDPAGACAEVDALVEAPTRAHRFIAWKALSACGRKEEAQRLGAALGI